MPFSDQLLAARAHAAAHCKAQAAPHPAYTLFFSVTDGSRRATVVHGRGSDFDAAWRAGEALLAEAVARKKLEGGWLRVDWVETVERVQMQDLERRLAATKRNYFRHGLAFDADFAHAYTEQELNANAMLYGGNTVAHAVFNPKNFAVYAKTRFGLDGPPRHPPAHTVFVLGTRGVFCRDGEAPLPLDGPGPDAGRRAVTLDDGAVFGLVDRAAAYLARQVKETGEFTYGWFPCFDREIPSYNALRHASSTYALVEAWERVRAAPTHGVEAARLGEAIERALHYLTHTLIRTVTLPDGRSAAFLVDTGNEIKLGGNAVCLLALVKYSEVSGRREHLPLLERLATGIASMQDPASGRFDHVLHADSLAVKEAFRIIYYDGEAAFGLMRLYGLTGDPRWLETVERALEHFIAAEHWRAHDHWLSYCVNELTRHKPDERYFRFGIRNVADHLDFVLARETTFPTLLELMLAAEQMLRLDGLPRFRHLLRELDLGKFHRALDHRARHLLNGHFWPELAMYFRRPARIVDSFFIRHDSFRVRIDDVEHYLSGFVAYLKRLAARPGQG